MTDNFQQRVFEAFPRHPQFITIFSLREKFLDYDEEVLREAVRRLIRLKKVEKVVLIEKAHLYRLVKGARCPTDMRGHHPNVGRKPKHAAR